MIFLSPSPSRRVDISLCAQKMCAQAAKPVSVIGPRPSSIQRHYWLCSTPEATFCRTIRPYVIAIFSQNKVTVKLCVFFLAYSFLTLLNNGFLMLFLACFPSTWLSLATTTTTTTTTDLHLPLKLHSVKDVSHTWHGLSLLVGPA